jgi:hypothetical protein
VREVRSGRAGPLTKGGWPLGAADCLAHALVPGAPRTIERHSRDNKLAAAASAWRRQPPQLLLAASAATGDATRPTAGGPSRGPGPKCVAPVCRCVARRGEPPGGLEGTWCPPGGGARRALGEPAGFPWTPSSAQARSVLWVVVPASAARRSRDAWSLLLGAVPRRSRRMRRRSQRGRGDRSWPQVQDQGNRASRTPG